MKKRESSRKRVKERAKKIKIEKQKKILETKRLEINGPSNTSLSFGFGNNMDYVPDLSLFKSSRYRKRASRLFNNWKTQNRWRKKTAQRRKDHLICIVANLISIPRTKNSREIRKSLSLKVTKDMHLYKVIRFLREKKYINFLPGYCFSEKSFQLSKIYATTKFEKRFPPFHGNNEYMHHVQDMRHRGPFINKQF